MRKDTRINHRFLKSFLATLFSFCIVSLMTLTWIDFNAKESGVLIRPQESSKLLISEDRLPVIANPDGMQWIIHSQEAASKDMWRLPRWTEADNYPYGRPLNWPSLHSYWLRFLGWLLTLSNGIPIGVAIAKAAVFCNPAYLLFFSIPITYIAFNIHGIKGVLCVPILALFLTNPRYGLRFPDHHLLHICLTFLFLLVLADDKSKSNRGYQWIIAGVLLGLLFWTSALSAVIVTIAGFLSFPFSQKTDFRPKIEALLLFTGTASLVICLTYFWDYYPTYEIHLECVHPIYAFFLILSTFLLQQWCVIVTSRFDLKQISIRRIVYPLIATLALGLLILFNISDWYTPSNPFLARWMKLIGESRPIDLSDFFFSSNFTIVIFLLTALGAIIKSTGRQKGIIHFHLLFIGIILLFSLIQNRISDYVWPSMTVLVILVCSVKRKEPIGVLLTSLVLFMGINRFQNQRVTADEFSDFGDTRKLDPYIANSYNLQIESQKVLESISSEPGSILTVPEIGMYLNYYTKFPVYGTFYWENYDGMLRNMHMVFRRIDPTTFTFPDMLEFLKAAKVDYVCVPKENLDLRFSYTIYGSKDRIRVPEDCFFGYLASVNSDQIPDWLKLLGETEKTRLFKLTPHS